MSVRGDRASASPSSYFARRSTEPATVSRGHYSRSRAEKLHLSGDKPARCPELRLARGKRNSENRAAAIKLPEICSQGTARGEPGSLTPLHVINLRGVRSFLPATRCLSTSSLSSFRLEKVGNSYRAVAVAASERPENSNSRRRLKRRNRGGSS